MKKTVYLAVITLITIGCVLFGFANGEVSFPFGIGNSNYSIEESATLEAFDRITVDAAVMDLIVKEGSTYELDYRGTKNLVMSYQVDNGALVVSQKKNGSMIGNNSAVLTLTVPADTQLESVDIGIDVGDIDLKGMNVNAMDADLDVGDMTIEKTVFDEIVIDSDTGDIKLNNCSFVNLDISCDVGDVKVDSGMDISEYTYDLKTDVGEVEVNAAEYGRKYYKEGEKGKIVIHGDVGDISVNG